MALPVRWLLSQPELALKLMAGAGGLDADVTFVVTTELSDPARWLSGGELLLTTGIALPSSAVDRRAYLQKIAECGVAAVGFGVGLSHPSVPEDLVTAADEYGLPLLEVPLPTPFVAVAKKVTERLAELRYESMLRASRAQPRMTRSAIQGGVYATIRELSVACSATVLLLDPSMRVIEAYPDGVDEAVVAEVADLAASGSGSVASSVARSRTGATVAVQVITGGNVVHGYLAAISDSSLGHVEQILLGHANSLLALDFEKPHRLRAAQNRLNSEAIGLLLSTEINLAPARAQMRQAADSDGLIRAMTVLCDSDDAVQRVVDVVDAIMTADARQTFVRRDEMRVTALLRGRDGSDVARRLVRELGSRQAKSIRVGLSTVHPVDDVTDAVQQSALTASAAAYGGQPVEFESMTGSALLTFPESRRVLDELAETMIAPLVAHDREQGTDLEASLRAYLEANGHWESAAATIGVHRHTLRSRITRIEDLLGCDLDVARVRAELLLAIIARQG
ncbi:Regulator of polyketide synthase expression [Rhodococcus sp. RD6.2]|jgi:purine catabolism regulator|uniref:PucR family transcriptional regulator n=1 Tax=Rhodococcus sp. RD6.2 TaxID=260936 RepID=UPI00063B31FE|nr:PucR family transcriptional regulator [Rhodococcus sp. RD6.2]CRK52553.1 Regulator of polyketide synthase expression [Rhodococcus sp. RD6.2]